MPTGQLDPSFGSGGVVLNHAYGEPAAVSEQPDGKILVAFGYQFEVLRLNPDGTVDSSFGTNGLAAAPALAVGSASALAVEGNGDIVVAGSDSDQGSSIMAAARYLPNGQLDSSFASGGVFETSAAQNASAVLPEPSGAIVIASGGLSDSVFRLTASGALDPSFGSEGQASGASPEPNDAALAPDGSIVTVSDPYAMVVGRYTPEGQIDTSFGDNGTVAIPPLGTTGSLHTPYASGTSVVVQPDGKILVGGFNDYGDSGLAEFELVRLLPDGSLDQSFGTGGRSFVWPSPTGQWFDGGSKEIALGGNGNILSVGLGYGNGIGWFDLTRTLGDGSSGALETAPPDTTITSPAPSGPTASFSFTSSEPSGGFQCEVNVTAWTPCSSPITYTGPAGNNVFYVRAVNASGNVDPSPASIAWNAGPNDVFGTAPDTSITSAPPASTSAPSASFSFSSTGNNASYQCTIDQGPTTICTSPTTYTGLAPGSHTFSVASTSGGFHDTTPANYTWTITPDTTPPETTITASPAATTTNTSANFSFTSSESNSTFTCSLDNTPPSACSSPTSYSGLAIGSHTFQVEATDPAGNTDPTPASYTWTIQAPPGSAGGSGGGSGSGSGGTPRALTPPRISGVPTPGHVLHASAPVWSATPSRVAYQWQLCTRHRCRPIRGATRRKLRLTRTDAGHSVRITATASIDGITITSRSRKIHVKRK